MYIFKSHTWKFQVEKFISIFLMSLMFLLNMFIPFISMSVCDTIRTICALVNFNDQFGTA